MKPKLIEMQDNRTKSQLYRKTTNGNIDLILDDCDIRVMKNGRLMIAINTYPQKAVDIFSVGINPDVVNKARPID